MFFFKLVVTFSSVDGGWAECFPYNSFTDIGSNKQRNTRT